MLTQTPAEAARERFEGMRKRLRESFPAPRNIRLGPFYVDKYEVTNRQYRRFFEQAKDPQRRPGLWYGPTYNIQGPMNPKFYELWKDAARNADDQPITCVSKKDALAYAQWAGKRLPRREEWQRAALGDGNRLFPWGNDFAPDLCKCGMNPSDGQTKSAPALERVAESTTRMLETERKSVRVREALRIAANLPAAARELRAMLREINEPAVPAKVGTFSKDVSPFGCYDLGGNVSEWVVQQSRGLARGREYVTIGGNAGSFSVEYLLPAQERSYEAPGKLVGFRTVLPLGEARPQAQPRD